MEDTSDIDEDKQFLYYAAASLLLAHQLDVCKDDIIVPRIHIVSYEGQDSPIEFSLTFKAGKRYDAAIHQFSPQEVIYRQILCGFGGTYMVDKHVYGVPTDDLQKYRDNIIGAARELFAGAADEIGPADDEEVIALVDRALSFSDSRFLHIRNSLHDTAFSFADLPTLGGTGARLKGKFSAEVTKETETLPGKDNDENEDTPPSSQPEPPSP